MPEYVTHGKVQFTKKENAGSFIETVQIAPAPDYTIKYGDKRYVRSFDNADPTSHKDFKVDNEFPFCAGLEELLTEAAFKSICLKITIDNGGRIIGVTIPATL